MATSPKIESPTTVRPWPGLWGGIWLSLLWIVLVGVMGYVAGAAAGAVGAELSAAMGLAAGSVLAYALILPLARERARTTFRELLPLGRLHPAGLGAVLLGFGGVTVLLMQAAALSVLVIPMPEMIVEQLMELVLSDPLGFLVMGVVVAPIGEELLFRGVILRGLLRRYGTWTAALASALLFALAHLNPWQAVLALPLGLLLAWLYLRTRSLLPCIAAHAACNLQPWLIADAGGGIDADPNAAFVYPAWLLVAGGVAAAVGFALQVRLFRPQPPAELRR